MALRRAVVLLVSTGVLLAACAAGPAKDIKGTLEEWKITLTPTTGAAGEVTFTIDNIGEKDHEFVIVKTDLAPDALPTAEDGSVDEEGDGVELIDEIEDIPVGESQDVTATLDAGSYVLICNIVEGDEVHYAVGMRTAFTVE